MGRSIKDRQGAIKMNEENRFHYLGHCGLSKERIVFIGIYLLLLYY